MALKRLIIYPSKMGSNGARQLRRAFNTKMVYPDGHYKPRPNDVVVNWGASEVPNWVAPTIVNHWLPVSKAINKFTTFKLLEARGVSTLWNTDNTQVALDCLAAGNIVFARKTVVGTRGVGIMVMKTPADIVDAPLYTKFERKCKEYRVHVAFGQVIDFQQKKRRNGEDADSFIRNHDNGWIFARENVILPEGMGDVCIAAIKALGLDFGAVDILHNPKTGECFVLEINTAPGLEGTTLERYVGAFKSLL